MSTTATYPGRLRLAVDNDDATDWHGLLWGFRSANYDSAPTAALTYEAEALGVLDAGTAVAHAGASGGTVLKHPSLPADAWCPVMSTNMGGTAFLTHQGSYRVWARCYSAAATPQLRFLWDVGDMTNPAMNDPAILPGAGNWYLCDLGQILLRPPGELDSSRWQGVIQAKAATQGDQIEIDRLYFQPLDDGAGRLSAVQRDSALGISVVKPAGAGADDAAVGTKAWDNPSKVTAQDDDYASCDGRTLHAGTTHYLKASTFGFAIPAAATISGIAVTIRRSASNSTVDSAVRLMQGGTVQAPNGADTVTPWPSTQTSRTYGSQSDLWGQAPGYWTPAFINDAGFGVVLSATMNVDALLRIDFISITIAYTTSGGFAETADAVIYAGHSAELRTNGMIRQDATGNAYGPIASVIGSLPRIPPSGLEAKPVEVFLRPSRGNFADEPDAGIDDISAKILYRPCYLYTP